MLRLLPNSPLASSIRAKIAFQVSIQALAVVENHGPVGMPRNDTNFCDIWPSAML